MQIKNEKKNERKGGQMNQTRNKHIIIIIIIVIVSRDNEVREREKGNMFLHNQSQRLLSLLERFLTYP